MVKGLSYAEAGLKTYEEQVLETKRRALYRLAKELGRVVLPSLAELQTTETYNPRSFMMAMNSPPALSKFMESLLPLRARIGTLNRKVRKSLEIKAGTVRFMERTQVLFTKSKCSGSTDRRFVGLRCLVLGV